MITFCAPRAPWAAVLLVLLAGCSREQQDWRSAEAAGTTEAYARFVEQHADSELASEARARVARIEEERDWQRADASGTIEAYRQFLAQHGHGKWAEQARIRIEGFSLGSAPRTAQAPANVAAGRTGVNALLLATGVPGKGTAATPAPAAQPTAVASAAVVPAADLAQPAPADAAVQAPATAADAGYGVQLGAFGSHASADREWQRLQDRFGAQLGGRAARIVVASTGAGELYRLQAPTRGEAEARALCDALKEQAQACVPVIPR